MYQKITEKISLKSLSSTSQHQQEELDQNSSMKEERKGTTWNCRDTGQEERIPENQGPPEEP